MIMTTTAPDLYCNICQREPMIYNYQYMSKFVLSWYKITWYDVLPVVKSVNGFEGVMVFNGTLNNSGVKYHNPLKSITDWF